MRKNQKGFSALFIVLIIVVVGIIGVAGFVVYSSHRDNKSTASSNPCSVPPGKEVTATSEPSVNCLEQSANTLDPLRSKRPEVSVVADSGNVDPCGHKIPGVGYAPAVYQFTASQDSGPTKVATYYFTFGDGTLGTSHDGKISHTYEAPGRYSVGLTAIDVKGIKTYGNSGTDLTVYKPGQLDPTSQMWKDRLQTDPNACQGT